MTPIAFFFWKLRMSVWVFKHAWHATQHQVNGSSIDMNYASGYFRCRRCQAQLALPTNITEEGK